MYLYSLVALVSHKYLYSLRLCTTHVTVPNHLHMSLCACKIMSANFFHLELVVKQNGDSLEFTCTAKVEVIKWRVNGEPADQTSAVASGGQTTSTYKLSNLTMEDAGEYECHTTDMTTIQNFTLNIISSMSMYFTFSLNFRG